MPSIYIPWELLWFPRVSYCDSDVFRRKTPKSHFRSCLYVVSGGSFGRGTSPFPFGVCLGLIADVIPYSFWVDPWSRPFNGSGSRILLRLRRWAASSCAELTFSGPDYGGRVSTRPGLLQVGEPGSLLWVGGYYT